MKIFLVLENKPAIVSSMETTPPHMNEVILINLTTGEKHTVTNWDMLSISMTSRALKMAISGLYMVPPKHLRATTSHWLGKLGVQVKARAPWSTLSQEFQAHFGELIRVSREQLNKGE